MTEPIWNEENIAQYNFVVKPGAPDYEERVCEFTLEDHIQQAKAFRAWEWDRYGTTGELGPEYFEMSDDNIRDMEEELHDRDFNENFDKLSDEDVLYTARTWLINLTANGNENARKMGFGEENIDAFRENIAAMEKAVEEEKKAIYKQEKDRVNKASAELLKKLGPTSKPFMSHRPKPLSDGDNN